MPVHFKKFRLSEWNGSLAALFISFGLAGCTEDIAAIFSTCCGVAVTNVGTVVGYVAAGGGLFMAASQVSPVRQRYAPAIALTVGAFFVGNLSPQIFPAVFAGYGPLFHDLPDILVIALLCIAGFLAVLNKVVAFKKSANFFEGAPVRPQNSRLDGKVGERSAGVTKPQAAAVDLFGFSQDALVVTDAEGVVLEIDRGAETMFGWTRKHLVGQSVEVLIPHCKFAGTPGPNDSSVHYSAPRILATERQKLRGVRKNGTTFAVEVSLSPGARVAPTQSWRAFALSSSPYKQAAQAARYSPANSITIALSRSLSTTKLINKDTLCTLRWSSGSRVLSITHCNRSMFRGSTRQSATSVQRPIYRSRFRKAHSITSRTRWLMINGQRGGPTKKKVLALLRFYYFASLMI